jgi:rare lipoprotein A (peptidoglycan hydrolase)
MRTYLLAALTIATFGLVAVGPANAENAPWQCMSPAFACGGAPTAKTYRSNEYTGERSRRRQASTKRKSPRIAKSETVKEKTAAKRVEAKVDLPEKKQQAKIETPKVEAPAHKQQHAAIAPSEKTPALEKKPEIAVRSVETESTVRVTSTQSGMASYYWQGQMTASGVRFNPSAMTAAHRSLPFGTKVRVTNKRNGKSVIVTINDRGPFIRGRIIDLSNAAAGIIGMRSAGVAPVTVERIARN